jgi:hypothetical protein
MRVAAILSSNSAVRLPCGTGGAGDVTDLAVIEGASTKSRGRFPHSIAREFSTHLARSTINVTCRPMHWLQKRGSAYC